MQFFPDKLINYLKDKFEDINKGDQLTRMKIYETNVQFIVAMVDYGLALLCLIIMIAAWVYHCSIYEFVKKVQKERDDGDPILRDLSAEDSIPIVCED